ncbi:MAG: hypothetical protein HN356_15060 [Calditrichaeota bacterium]|jgi:hypothetical protein|nr:hypothetical protein [Calditrichota bacterium]
MSNGYVESHIEGKGANRTLVLRIALEQDCGESKSGRTRKIAYDKSCLAELSGLKKDKPVYYQLNVYSFKGASVKRRRVADIKAEQEELKAFRALRGRANVLENKAIANEAPF